MIGPFSSCKIGKTWGLQNEKKPYVKWEKARKPLSNGRKWANYLPRYHVTELISEQVSDFCFGHRKWLFWSEEKQWKWLFLTLKTGTSGAQDEIMRPVLKSGLWRGNMVRNLLTSGHRKVVFWLFLNLCTWANSSFTKEERLHQKMYKIKLAHCCDVVPNLVVEIENFNFCLFVCLLVCLYLTFCQFRKRKMVQS